MDAEIGAGVGAALFLIILALAIIGCVLYLRYDVSMVAKHV